MLSQLAILFIGLASALGCRTGTEIVSNQDWWKTTAFYQIYPRSFKDSDGDGVGDLNGITSKLDHLVDAGVGALWISPIYPSPMADFGYDISNFVDIDPLFGTLDDFDGLVARAKQLNLKVILDFVPNHSSDEHQWFKKSVRREDPYTDYYIWRDGKNPDDTGKYEPPNNWLSTFQGSAWEWNEERGQFYLHQFVKGQPDLNYRNANLRKEMENVLSFWLKRGVEGFRIDAINHMFEDDRFLDEPSSNNANVSAGYYDSLNHIYSKDQPETYDVLQSWRDLLDKYAQESNTDTKVIMTEGYANTDLVMQYYTHGSNIPFNFGFITNTRSGSTAAEFKSVIDSWLDSMPENYVANWVTGNHDQRRVASRYGSNRADQMSIVCLILPGISVTYNGDEIGMLDGEISWVDSVDPAACNTDAEHFEQYSRDPERTPYQWDSTTSAGFSTSSTTWLPVNRNYVSLNLAAQKAVSHSHYHVYQAMTALRKLPIFKRGSLSVEVLADNVLAITRSVTGATPIVALVNCAESSVSINVKNSIAVLDQMTVYTSSVSSGITPGRNVTTSSVQLPAATTIVLTSPRLYQIVHGA
ncbi:maltase 1-like [Neodiprion virginianus]|uniref:maltase 1-like n=1 Tax=Neodiprion virginianus TaxID=2961670 RepID=UPI001EE7054A|nr:maltase 1-like [Neodiprion virginianus]